MTFEPVNHANKSICRLHWTAFVCASARRLNKKECRRPRWFTNQIGRWQPAKCKINKKTHTSETRKTYSVMILSTTFESYIYAM